MSKELVPTLDGFLKALDATKGFYLREIGPNREIVALTPKGEYYILILEPETGQVLVRGGKEFPQPTRCVFNGSTFGGSMIKMRWVGAGMCLEFFKDGQCITTDFIDSIGLVLETPPSALVQ